MANEERQPSVDQESRIGDFVRAYVHAARGPDAAEEDEALRWLCSGFEWLLGTELEGRDGWKGWVDGVTPALGMVPDAVKVVSDIEVSIRGYADWLRTAGHNSPALLAKAQSGAYIEPFFGSVRISEADDVIIGYDLRFGDAARRLGRVPYGKHIRWEQWFFPQEWLFTFRRGD